MSMRIPGQIVEGYTFPVYDEQEVRAAAGITLAAGTVAFCYAYFEHRFLPIKVVSTFFFVEFLIRVFAGFQYSPTGIVSRLLLRRRDPQWVSAKPKRFAWSMGLGMAGAMTIITNVNIHGTLPRTICLICIVLMWLETSLGFCVGCALHAQLMKRGILTKDEAFEVCAGGVCEVPERVEPVEPVEAVSA